MKINNVKSENFNPIEVRIVVESEKELDVLTDMCCMDLSIPEIVKDDSGIVKMFLNKLKLELFK